MVPEHKQNQEEKAHVRVRAVEIEQKTVTQLHNDLKTREHTINHEAVRAIQTRGMADSPSYAHFHTIMQDSWAKRQLCIVQVWLGVRRIDSWYLSLCIL